MQLFTIGFTKKSAEQFFTLLRDHGVRCLVDTRLHPGGQLAGFAREGDLGYFCRNLADCEYMRMAQLAPSDAILSAYRADHNWATYTAGYLALMAERAIPASLDRAFFQSTACCLLCSEATPDQCHRRLLAELLAQHWPDVEIIHLI